MLAHSLCRAIFAAICSQHLCVCRLFGLHFRQKHLNDTDFIGSHKPVTLSIVHDGSYFCNVSIELNEVAVALACTSHVHFFYFVCKDSQV